MRTFVVRKFITQSSHFNKQLHQLKQELIERIGEYDILLNYIYNAIENILDKESDKKEAKLQWA